MGYVSTNACIGFCQAGRMDGGRQPLSDHAVNVYYAMLTMQSFGIYVMGIWLARLRLG